MAQDFDRNDLSAVRRELCQALGDQTSKYFASLKQWFREKISKEDFDSKARKLFTNETVHLHNHFLLAIFTRCQIDTSQPSGTYARFRQLKRGVKRPPPNFEKSFLATPELSGESVVPARILPPAEIAREGIYLCDRDGCLPDSALMHGRVLLGAWESGLEDIHDDAVKLIYQALEDLLKNVLQAMISLRKSHVVRAGRFPHSFGFRKPPGYAANRNQKNAVLGPGVQASTTFISPLDLLDVLEMNCDLIPSHVLRTSALERILCSIDHEDIM